MEKYIPIVIIEELSETDKILTALKNNGINCAEITLRTDCAEAAIEYACKNYPDMNIGAGTVINAEQCAAVIEKGAQFIVSPGLSQSIANVCKLKNVPYYPGCVTPTEIMSALELGLTTLKFFPVNVYGGLEAIKMFASPFPQVKFIPTGFTDPSCIDEYLKLDNVAAVGGSHLVKDSQAKLSAKSE